MFSENVESTVWAIMVFVKASVNKIGNQAKRNSKANTAGSYPSISCISWLLIHNCCHMEFAAGTPNLNGISILSIVPT